MCRVITFTLAFIAALLAPALPAAWQPPPPPGMEMGPPLPPLWQPSDATQHAWTDCRKLASDVQRYTRYLDIGHIPAKDRPGLIQVLSGQINALSVEPDLVPLAILKGTQGSLLRLNLLDYGIKTGVWEMLADADPYYRVQLRGRTKEKWPGGTWEPDGLRYEAGSFNWNRQKTALSPLLSEGVDGLKNLLELVSLTESQVPIVRGDWFLWQTAVQELRQPGYYDFLGVKDQKTFEKVVRFDAKLAAKLEQRRVLVFSGITLQPRRVERTQSVLGGLWRTFDNEDPTGTGNPLRFLDNDFTFKATRQFAPLPGGMPAWYLGNNKGGRQNKAPDNIVGGDRHGGGNDTRLLTEISCLRCHFMGKAENGVKAIDSIPIKGLRAVEYAKLVELRRQYLREVEPLMERDRQGYELAIKVATGRDDGARVAAGNAEVVFVGGDAKIDLKRAAQELGMPAPKLLAALRAQDAIGTLDPVLSVIMNGGAIPNALWAEIFATAAANARGLVLPPNTMKLRR